MIGAGKIEAAITAGRRFLGDVREEAVREAKAFSQVPGKIYMTLCDNFTKEGRALGNAVAERSALCKIHSGTRRILILQEKNLNRQIEPFPVQTD